MTDDILSPDSIHINGTEYTIDDLSFREQREVRAKVQELAPENDAENAGMMDIFPAMIWAIIRRDNPDFTIDEALDMKPSDLMPQNGNGNGSKARPTKPRAKK